MAKYLTLSGLQTFYAGIKTKLGTKVDKVEGYGLSKNDLTDALKANYDAAYTYATTTDAEKNVIVGVQVNGTDLIVDGNRKVNIAVPTGALASKDSVAETDLAEALATKINGKVDAQDGYSLISATDLAKIGTNETAIGTLNGDASTEGSVDYKIAQAVASTYKVQGAKAFADLATATKTVGYVYNITDAFTTTDAFVEGAGKSYPAGTNVVWTTGGWDCLAGTYDLSGFALASQVATDIATAKGEVIGTAESTKDSDTVKGAKLYAADAASTAQSTVIGTAEDAKTADTVNGAKAFATDAASTAQSTAVSTVVGQASDEKTANTVNGAKAFATDAATTAKSDVVGQNTDDKDASTVYGAKAFATDAASTAQTTVIGTAEDAKTADTVNGAKAFATDAATTAKSAVIGASTDEKTADTVNGAKAFATDAATTAKSAVIGTAADTKDADTINGAKAYADSVVSTSIVAITDDEIAEILNS